MIQFCLKLEYIDRFYSRYLPPKCLTVEPVVTMIIMIIIIILNLLIIIIIIIKIIIIIVIKIIIILIIIIIIIIMIIIIFHKGNTVKYRIYFSLKLCVYMLGTLQKPMLQYCC